MKYNTRYCTWRQNFKEQYTKSSGKMYKHIVQQIVEENVQQKERNSYVALLIKKFVITKLVVPS